HELDREIERPRPLRGRGGGAGLSVTRLAVLRSCGLAVLRHAALVAVLRWTGLLAVLRWPCRSAWLTALRSRLAVRVVAVRHCSPSSRHQCAPQSARKRPVLLGLDRSVRRRSGARAGPGISGGRPARSV